METKIKNTLFRFTSLRSPELSDEKKQSTRFIIFPQLYRSSSFFYETAVNNNSNLSKLEVLKSLVSSFESSSVIYQSDQEIKTEFDALYEFSTWLARNKSTCTEQDLVQKIQALNSPSVSSAKMTRLWDNLFYQIISQKSFYTKEMIMQLLLAVHLGAPTVAHAIGVETFLNLSKARVVIPKEIFYDKENVKLEAQNKANLEAVNVALAFPNDELKKQQLLSLEQRKVKNAEAIKKELQKSEKKYRKAHQTAFELAQKNHEALIAPIWAQYEEDVEEERKRWCALRTSESKYDLNDPCNQPNKIPLPAIPVFSFSFGEEIDANRIGNELNPNTLIDLVELLGYEGEESVKVVFETLLDDFETYDELYGYLDSVVKTSTKAILDNTDLNQKKMVSVGGVLMPVESAQPAQPFNYQICPKSVGKNYNFDFSVVVPNSSWQVTNVLYRVNYQSGQSNTNGYHIKTVVGNRIYLKDLFGNGLTAQQIQNTASFEIEITFSNGQKLSKTITGINTVTCAFGKFTVLEEQDSEGFIPNQFGYKQIGIADYKKVEQSVQCYVAGEVSHIENVMASEYREKSTRRLRRTEDTTTVSSETEREQLTDTTSVSRFEMQSEVAKLLQESKDVQASTSFNASYGVGGSGSINLGANAGFASHTSKEESTRQAMVTAQEITERALDRVVSKVKEERIQKVIEEFEENNMHGYDNRGTDKHVSGVYRWVDKLYKNQIVNYGKRLMFEFMIPQPSKLHLLGLNEAEKDEFTLIAPPDPRKVSDGMQLIAKPTDITEAKAEYWAGYYNVEIKAKPENEFYISKSFSKENADHWAQSAELNIDIPENYRVISFSGFLNTSKTGEHSDGNGQNSTKISIAGKTFPMTGYPESGNGSPFRQYKIEASGLNICKTLGISLSSWRTKVYGLELSLKCALDSNVLKQWQQEAFNAIITAYEEKLAEYNEKRKEFESQEQEIVKTNPGFYRKIENMVLRKNCISYMMDRTPGSLFQYGREGMYLFDDFMNLEVNTNSDLDTYASFVKFMEQAFEWENISYNFYPYYWGNKYDWGKLYNTTEGDSLFHSFLQSGMARVIAPVRPGFEDAVQFYMATGLIWNGGQVPVIGDPLFMSIVDELKEIKGEPEGKAWITRVPTALTIIQAGSIGLEVEEALPCNCDDTDDFENPDEIPCNTNFKKLDNTMEGAGEGISAMEIKPFQVQ